MKREISNLYCVLAEIRDELHLQNMIEVQRNEIMKEQAFQTVGSARILKVDTKIINKKLAEEIQKIKGADKYEN